MKPKAERNPDWTRDELILAALDCWMEENRYSGLTRPHGTDASLYVGLMRVLRTIISEGIRPA